MDKNLVTMSEDEIFEACVANGDVIGPLKLVAYSLNHYSGILADTAQSVVESNSTEELNSVLQGLGEACSDVHTILETAKKTIRAMNRAIEVLVISRDIIGG